MKSVLYYFYMKMSMLQDIHIYIKWWVLVELLPHHLSSVLAGTFMKLWSFDVSFFIKIELFETASQFRFISKHPSSPFIVSIKSSKPIRDILISCYLVTKFI